jgi:hypothetical protein
MIVKLKSELDFFKHGNTTWIQDIFTKNHFLDIKYDILIKLNGVNQDN